MLARKTYNIRTDYVHRLQNEFFDDTPYKDEYQNEVYEMARMMANAVGAEVVADVGCGSGYKLMKYFANFTTIGLELQPTLDHLYARYPDRKWIESSFSTPLKGVDIVVCADVIEHIPDPDLLMDFLASIACKALVISTPERYLVYGNDHLGPPRNPAHCREWTSAELNTYIAHWFDIKFSMITNQTQATQALICTPKVTTAIAVVEETETV